MSPDTWAAMFTIFRNLVFGLASLGVLFVVLAWQFLASLELAGSWGAQHRYWLPMLAAVPIGLAWSRTCKAMYRDTSSLENDINGKTTVWSLAVGVVAMTLFFVLPDSPGDASLSSERAVGAAIWAVIALAAVDLWVWVRLLFSRKLTLREKCSWLFFSTRSVLALATVVAATVALTPTTRQHVPWLFDKWPEQAYLFWLVLIMMHAWEWTRAHGILVQGWRTTGGNQFRFDRAIVGDFITLVLCICLVVALPLLLKLFPRSEEASWYWVLAAIFSMGLGGISVIFNALVMVSQGGQANPIQREWWARWGSEFMLAVSTLSAALAAGGLALLVPQTTAQAWLVPTIGGAVVLVILGMIQARNQFSILLFRAVGMGAVLLTIVACFLAARSLGTYGGVDIGGLGITFNWLIALLALISLLVLLRSGPNTFSMHELYRNRLVRAFLGASNPDRQLVHAVDFATNDDLALADLVEGEQGGARPVVMRPFPLWCGTVNVTTSRRIGLQERKAASFSFSPLYCGLHVDALEQARGSRPTDPRADRAYAPVCAYGSEYAKTSLEYEQEPLTVGTVVATSGAAFSSNTGATTKPERALLLTLLGFRLGRWFPNPATCVASDVEDEQRPSNPWTAGLPLYISSRPWAIGERLRAWLSPLLLREALSKCDVDASAVYVTDGGHFENLGVYEMLRRRAKLIVVVDAACDPKFQFDDLLNLQSKARSDFGVELCLEEQHRLAMGPTGEFASVSHLEWPIIYRRDANGIPSDVGRLIYCKSTLTGDEPSDLLAYRQRVPSFPHISTVNQWFAESAFEAYRSLGLHIGRKVAESFTSSAR